MIGFTAERLMELEMQTLTGAGHGERDWEARTRTVERRIPKLREGSYPPCFLKPRHMAKRR